MYVVVDITNSTAGSPLTTYQLVTLLQGATTYYAVQTPGTNASLYDPLLTTALFQGVALANGDIITHSLYNGPDPSTATLLSQASYQVLSVCLTEIGFPGVPVCWNSVTDDYCEYPMELNGFGGTLVYSFANVYTYMQTYTGGNYTLDTGTGCYMWLITPGSRKRVTTAPAQVRTGIPRKYMIYTATPATGTLTIQIPLQPLTQTTFRSHNLDIDWGDGTIDTLQSASVGTTRSRTYASTAVRTIRLAGTSHCLCYTSLSGVNLGKLVTISQWGTVVSYQMNFYDELRLGSLSVTATDGPNPSLVDIRQLFGVSTGLVTLGQYASRVTTFAGWNLPSVVTATTAFGGMNMSTGIVLPSTLTAAASMYTLAIMPTTFVMGTMSLATSASMFASASFPGTAAFTGVSSASPASMFSSATFTGAVSMTGGTFTSPTLMFNAATFTSSFTTSAGPALTTTATSMFSTAIFLSSADMSGFNVAGVITATSMFATMRVAGAYTSPGVFSSATDVSSMYSAARCHTAPCPTWNMASISFPVATTVASAFALSTVATTFSNIPNLSLAQAITCTSLFSSTVLTFGDPFVPVWPSMKCTTATFMFQNIIFLQGADMSGMSVAQVVTANFMFSTLRILGAYTSPGVFSSATNVASMFSTSRCHTTGCPVWNMTALSFPVATTADNVFAFAIVVTKLSNMPNLSLAAATTCLQMFFASGGWLQFGERFVPVWPSMKCTTATNMFHTTTFLDGADFSGMSVAQVVTGTSMFNSMTVTGNFTSPGVFSAATDVSSMFAGARASIAGSPTWNMAGISFPVATTVASAFALTTTATTFSNIPNLSLAQATTCTSLFNSAVLTFGDPFVPVWPSMKCTTASTMFQSVIFLQGADMSGMSVAQVVNAGGMFNSMRILGAHTSAGVFSLATDVSFMYSASRCHSGTCPTWNMTGISFPVATTVASAFALAVTATTLSNIPNLSLAQAITCTTVFGVTALVSFGEAFVPIWPSMKCTTATNMFNAVIFLAGADMSGMSVTQVVTATSMFASIRVLGAYTSPGVFSAATDVSSMYSTARCQTAPCPTWNMASISFPVATNVASAFALTTTATVFSNIPSLSLAQATTCTSLFQSSVVTFGVQFMPVWPAMKCTTATSMFQSMVFSQGADFSGMSVAQVVTGTSMFQSSVHQGAVATIYPGPFTLATTVTSMFASSTYVTAPNMTLISIPVATVATSMFSSCNKVTALPNLNPVSLVTATSMFNTATIVADMGASTLAWSFPALQTATTMFQGTNFGSFPFYMHTWGMNSVTTLANFANTAANVPDTIDVGPWQVQQLLTLTGFFFSVNKPTLVLNFTLWSTIRMTSMNNAFASMGSVTIVGLDNLDVSRVTDMSSVFSGTPMTANITLTAWNTSSVTLAGSAFFQSIGSVFPNLASWNVARIATASSMFMTCNLDPDMTSWTWTSLLTFGTNTATSLIDQCYFSTPARYSKVIISLATTTALNTKVMGGPRSNPLSTTTLPTRTLQGYDSTASASRSALTPTRGWTLNDGGLM